MVTPPKIYLFWPTFFEILWFGMILEQLIKRGDHIYIFKYTCIHIHRHMHFPKLCNFANFPRFKIQDFGGNLPGLGFKKFFSES